MNKLTLRQQLRGVLAAGRRRVSLERLDTEVARRTPFDDVEGLAVAARDAGVPVGELSLADDTVEVLPSGREMKDEDPVRDLVAGIFDTDDEGGS